MHAVPLPCWPQSIPPTCLHAPVPSSVPTYRAPTRRDYETNFARLYYFIKQGGTVLLGYPIRGGELGGGADVLLLRMAAHASRSHQFSAGCWA